MPRSQTNGAEGVTLPPGGGWHWGRLYLDYNFLAPPTVPWDLGFGNGVWVAAFLEQREQDAQRGLSLPLISL